MKNIYKELLSVVRISRFLPALLAFFSLQNIFAQQIGSPDNLSGLTKEQAASIIEKKALVTLKQDGVSDAAAEQWHILRNKAYEREQNSTSAQTQKGQPPVTNAVCSGLSVETGWGAWQAAVGGYAGGVVSWNTTAQAPAAPAFNLITGAGTDGCTPGPAANSPAIPHVCPGFGNTSIQLGQPLTNGSQAGCGTSIQVLPPPFPPTVTPGGCVERLTYPLTVTPSDTNFVYSYAIVFDDNGHSASEQPFVSFGVYDPAGNAIPCTYFKYVAAGNLPGFLPANCSPNGVATYYKPWTLVGVNLSAYLGQTLTVEIINADCGQGGHFAHSYWDFKCGTLSGNSTTAACGQPATLCAPVDPQINYTYQWYQNGSQYTGPPSGTAQCINPIPQAGDTFSVAVKQPSGCNFYLTFTPQPANTFSVTTNSTAASCGASNGTAAAVVAGGSPPFTYLWTPSAAATATAAGLNAGNYSVTVTDAGGCSVVQTVTIANSNGPAAAFVNTTVCAGTPTQFTDTSVPIPGDPIATWSWSFGVTPAATSAQQNPSYTYTASGTYTVTLNITSAAGCTSTITQVVNVTFGTMTANFSAPAVCAGDPTPFTDLSGGATAWSWDFGDGTSTSSGPNPSHTYSAAGTYSVTLSVSGTCGTGTVTIPVTVNAAGVANFSNTNVCFNNPTLFTDLSVGATTWTWDFGDGTPTSSVPNPSHTYNTAGSFTVTLISSNGTGGCADTIQQPVFVNPLPAANFSSTSSCTSAQACFTDLSSISSGGITIWSWNFGDPNSGAQNISNQQSPCHVFSATGSFSVTLTVSSDSGCQSTAVIPVVFNGPPVAAFSSTNACLNTSSAFTDGSSSSVSDPVNAWTWDFGDGSATASQTNPAHVYSTAGNYTVTLIVTTQSGCKDTITNPVTVYRLPTVAFSDSAKGCAPVCQSFTDLSQSLDGTITSWQWNFQGGSPLAANTASANACWNTPGSYGVSLVVTSSYGCKDSLFVPNYIRVAPFPKADFCVAPAQASISDPVFTFCPQWSQDVTQWYWNFGDGSPLDSTSTNPVHSYSASTTGNGNYTYNVCVYVKNANGCYDSICRTVELVPEFTFYMPNAVTPNGDPFNALFFGKSRGVKDYSMWIFDRWGNQIWDCHYTGNNTDWDGLGQDGISAACKWDPGTEENKSKMVQEDVYVWKVKLTDIFDKNHDYVGHVSVVR